MQAGEESELERKCAYFQRRADELAGKLTAADARGSKLRHELEQRRRGFTLLADLHIRFYESGDRSTLYQAVLTGIGKTLNMDRAMVLERRGEGFVPVALGGYSETDQTALAQASITLPQALVERAEPVLVTKATPPDEMRSQLAGTLGVPFFIAVAVLVGGVTEACIVAGRSKETKPFMPRLDQGDVETLGAVANLIAATIERQRLAASQREAMALQAQVVENQRLALEELQRYNAAYSRFVPREFLERLQRASILEVQLGDQVQTEMSVFFSDIRAFTTTSERLTPQATFAFLNEYLSLAAPIVRENGGLIDKYIGDAIMALFPNRADDAIAAAVDLHDALTPFNRRLVERGDRPIEIGIGIHTGLLMLGTIGEAQRMETTVISDAVNLASRLESLTKRFGARILVSHNSKERLASNQSFITRNLGTYAVKGRAEPTTIWEICDGDEPAIRMGKLQSLEGFERALTRYRTGDFETARTLFAQIADAHPDDAAARYFSAHSKDLASNSPPKWNGVEHLTEK